MKNILCIGAGYVGGPTSSMIAKKCPDYNVKVVDIDKNRIDAWNSNQLPIYEPGLDEIVQEVRGRNLSFELVSPSSIQWADIIFVSVNTPTKTYGEGKDMASDLQYWEVTARYIAEHSLPNSKKIIVEKSTLPVKTAQAMANILHSSCNANFQVLSNPEFLAEGTAIKDLETPDRVLIGGMESKEGQKAIKALVDIYLNWVPREKILTANLWSAELSKLVANAFLAQRVSSINSISALCEKTEANIDEVSKSIGMDSRIGSKFLKAGIGFGGSCFKKDILNLVYICKSYGLNEVADYWESVVKINDYQKSRFVHNIIKSMFNTLAGKKIAILGVAFKSDTGDVRESPAISICKQLLEEKAKLIVHDPKALDNFRNYIMPSFNSPKYIEASSDISDVYDSHALVFLTDWKEYKSLNFEYIYSKMKKPAFIFDGRNFLDHQGLKKIGFEVYCIGKVFKYGLT